jgi:hypothetical protein
MFSSRLSEDSTQKLTGQNRLAKIGWEKGGKIDHQDNQEAV